jgi:hypothetical protein
MFQGGEAHVATQGGTRGMRTVSTPTESAHYLLTSDGPRWQSEVLIDGWAHKSLWGRDDGRFFLTLWRDDSPEEAAPDLWISVADRHQLHSPGCVVLALVLHLGVDPVTACAGVQTLCPAPNTDPRRAIREAALEGLDEVGGHATDGGDDYGLGQWTTYRWALGLEQESPAVNHRYPLSPPGYREIFAERDAVTGLVYQLAGRPEQTFFAGVDTALSALVHTFT